ncbi:MAG TPA: hypothetical protein VI953_01135 [Candidatus Paceibacterota bacterium]
MDALRGLWWAGGALDIGVDRQSIVDETRELAHVSRPTSDGPTDKTKLSLETVDDLLDHLVDYLVSER